MSWERKFALTILPAVFVAALAGSLSAQASPPPTVDRLTVFGIIEEAQGKGVKKAENELLVDGKPVSPLADERVDTGSPGGYSRQPQMKKTEEDSYIPQLRGKLELKLHAIPENDWNSGRLLSPSS